MRLFRITLGCFLLGLALWIAEKEIASVWKLVKEHKEETSAPPSIHC